MTAFYILNDGFIANDALFYCNKLGQLHYKLQCIQLIVYAIMKITIKGTTVPLYEFDAKQPKKEQTRGKKFCVKIKYKLGLAYEKSRNKERMKTREGCSAAEKLCLRKTGKLLHFC